MIYLITGATGDVGSKVVRELIRRGERPRVFVRDTAKARQQFGDAVDIFAGDLADSAALQRVLKGAHKLFLVNSGPCIPVLDELAAKAAKAAGTQHVVKLSSLDVEQHLAIGAWHEKGEAAIRAAEVPYTFLRPTGFLSNLLAWKHSIATEGVVRSSTGDGERPFIHTEDIAAVAVEALTTPKYIEESLPLTGPEALSFPKITVRIGAAIKRKLQFVPISDEEASRRFSATGVSEEETKAHVELWRAIREGRLSSITDGVRRVLGREPISLDQWLTENAAEFCK